MIPLAFLLGSSETNQRLSNTIDQYHLEAAPALMSVTLSICSLRKSRARAKRYPRRGTRGTISGECTGWIDSKLTLERIAVSAAAGTARTRRIIEVI